MNQENTSEKTKPRGRRGRRPVNFSPWTLPAEVRRQLDDVIDAADVLPGPVQAHFATAGYVMKVDTVRHYISQYRKAHGFPSRPGRPLVRGGTIDAIAHAQCSALTSLVPNIERVKRLVRKMAEIMGVAGGGGPTE